jgi:hypothetical protein
MIAVYIRIGTKPITEYGNTINLEYVPRKGEMVRVNGKLHTVSNVITDLDKPESYTDAHWEAKVTVILD